MRLCAALGVAVVLSGCGGGPDPPSAGRSASPRTAPSDAEGSAQLTPQPPGATQGGVTADDAPPSVRLAASRPPDEHGWYTSAVRVTADAFDDRALEDVCFWVVPNYPTGTSTSGVQLPCSAPASARFSESRDLKEEARHIVQLSARDSSGQEARADNLDVRMDLNAPATTFGPAPPAFRGRVVLQGEATDASSGVRGVALTFVRGSERRRIDATCSCSDIYRRNRPAESWRFDGELPAGRWTVRAEATDYAGRRESNAPTTEIEVL